MSVGTFDGRQKISRPPFAEHQLLRSVGHSRIAAMGARRRMLQNGPSSTSNIYGKKGIASMYPPVRQHAVLRLAVYLTWMSVPSVLCQTTPQSNREPALQPEKRAHPSPRYRSLRNSCRSDLSG